MYVRYAQTPHTGVCTLIKLRNRTTDPRAKGTVDVLPEATGKYRVQFEIVDKGARPARRDVEIEVSGENVGDATAKAREIARRDYGDSAKPMRIVTYFCRAALDLKAPPT
jgi:hypothetical protein